MHPRLSVVILGALLMACQDTATGSTAQPGSGDSVGPPRMSVAELRDLTVARTALECATGCFVK